MRLLTHGVERVFCVPGESFLAVLDSLHDETDRIQTIVCRHEAAAANMAEAVGKLTGRPGVAIVTRGPGATHASIGVHTAFQDSTPMILLIGQCAREHLDREAFQEIDYRRMFGQMAKWVAQIDDPKRIPEYLSHAFHTATSGRPGPVVLSLPEDVLSDACEAVPGAPRYKRVAASPSAAQMDELRRLLEGAQRPMVIAGGSGWTPAACADLQRFVENWQLPIGLAFRFQDTLDNEHPNYAGDIGLGINPALAQRIRDADLLLTLGPRLGEATTNGYTLLDIPKTKQTLVHVHQGAEELGRVYAADLPIVSGMPELAALLAALKPSSEQARMDRRGRSKHIKRISTGANRVRFPATCKWAKSSSSCARIYRTTRSSQTVRATTQRGCIGISRIGISARSSRRPAARWVTAYRRRSRRSRCIRNAQWSRSPATAVS